MINVTKVELPDIDEYLKYVKKIWKNEWVTNNGEFVVELEEKLKRYLKVKNLILVSNGTLALQLPLKALGLTGEVVTTPFTFIATTNSIIWEGLTPVFADINKEDFCIDSDDIERKITSKTSAILAVHVYGNPCNVEKLERLAVKYKLKLIFDAAHAFGVEYKNSSILNYGDISTLSFHATKVFNTIEGGAIIAKDDKVHEKMKQLRNFGIISEEEVVAPGINAKMNEFQAAMGLCNMVSIDEKIDKRKMIFDKYLKGLSDIEGIRFQNKNLSRYSYGYMPIILNDKETRDGLYDALLLEGIHSRKYFYPLTSDFKCMTSFNRGDTPSAKAISSSVLCLPMYSTLNEFEIEKIITTIKNYIKS